ncbi:hypothetical protein AB0I60_09445 [Actinosynnema sp. NPDC050436]|uniref:hypothetical protein n=1 Tax=Actinosynnema sp. NPDC050436 TaxID=3155659 RepID=UPI0033D841D7
MASTPLLTLSIGFDCETRIAHRIVPGGAEFSFPGGDIELIFDEGALEQLVDRAGAALAELRRP